MSFGWHLALPGITQQYSRWVLSEHPLLFLNYFNDKNFWSAEIFGEQMFVEFIFVNLSLNRKLNSTKDIDKLLISFRMTLSLLNVMLGVLVCNLQDLFRYLLSWEKKGKEKFCLQLVERNYLRRPARLHYQTTFI